ncbi:gamma-glutamyltransferase family protein [Sneathiella marina]|uniref:Gamma-glutamyltransferase family protein n=1 Tax=Sneathiella marina TaxID=2950108 RepID=A0ABY4W6U5_9PROT|nr:gamma-glutamyltransferase family protein [Sneathiella marina]USG62549.1 gamma-glutamyltransferase family protein [Sneathiella marina]
MLQTKRAYGGMVTSPHHLASRAGIRVLEEGGNAIEAMIAAAAMITVAYPHMNAMGGDNFWLIHTPGKKVQGIDACGGAAAKADIEYYKNQGFDAIPSRGSQAALTVAGAVSGWQEAYNFSQKNWGGTLPIDRLLEEAIYYADQGISVSQTFASNAEAKLKELENSPGFKDTYFIDGALPKIGARFHQPRIAETFRHLSKAGLDDFYRGDLARKIAADLERAGSPLRIEDLERHNALSVSPLAVDIAGHKLFNMPPPTQGLASLLLLGVYERLHIAEAETFDFIHGLVEATKRSFRIRDKHVTDPDFMETAPADFLSAAIFDSLASDIDMERALPWPEAAAKGDTVWLGAVDSQGRAVSFIQSIFWEFGSGVVLDETGITWQNRGTSFSLDHTHHNSLQPFRRPFHTIQPALAHLKGGRVMPYGTMGGEGQPQTQAMIFSRHVLYGQDLQQSISAPRWLLGRTWGAETSNLRIENRVAPHIIQQLLEAGHDLEVIGAYDEVMGHAGALVHHPNGLIEGAADPRSDGLALGF